MDLFLPNIAIYLPAFLMTLIALFLLGRIVLCFMPEAQIKNNEFVSVFSSLTLGVIVLVTLFAIIWSRGNSILLLSTIILILYFTWFKDKHSDSVYQRISISKQEWKVLGITAILALIVWGIAYLVFFVRTQGLIWCDFTFYSNLAEKLHTTQIENADFFGLLQKNATTYHWGDIWFTAIGICLGLHPLYTLLLLTYPCLFVILLIGGCALVKMIKRPMPFFLCVCIGLTFLFYKPFLSFFINWSEPIVTKPKLFFILIFLSAAMIYL